MRVTTLQDAVESLQEFNTIPNIAKALECSKGQVMNYASGKTRTCSDKVMDNLFDKYDILLDQWVDIPEYKKHRKARS